MSTQQTITVKSLVIGDVSKRSLGLDAVNNTSDLDKPISNLTQAAIDLKADQATTYTKLEVDGAISSLIADAPGALDTLNELAAALGDDENFATTVTDAIGVNATAIAANYLATPHNTDAVIICNQGDNLQARYDEAYALLPNGNVQSATNRASLVVMGGTYGTLTTTNNPNYVDITGIGSAQIVSLRFFDNYGTIDNLIPSGNITLENNFGIIKNCSCNEFRIEFLNAGTIRNCTCLNFYMSTVDAENTGIIDTLTANLFNCRVNEGRIENITTSSNFVTTYNNSTGFITNVKTLGYIEISTNFGAISNCSAKLSLQLTGGNYGTIKDIYSYDPLGTTGSYFTENYGVIDGYFGNTFVEISANYGLIRDFRSPSTLRYVNNYGIVENCESTSSTSNGSIGGTSTSFNFGTIKNCKALGNQSFGQQAATGVTDGCTGGTRAFAGDASQLVFDPGFGVLGTYRNCVGGANSFFGHNTTTNSIKTVEATYINCTGGGNSFAFVNTNGAETHFAGKAINCIGGNNSFSGAVTGAAKILNGAVLENCIGGFNSFAGTNGINEGAVLRCRTLSTGAAAFKATATGKVRLCLNGSYGEVNLG